MAEALISGLLHGKRITPAQLLASDINASKVARLRENYKIEAASTNRDVAKQADVLVLAVEPQALDEALADLGVVIREETLLISIASRISDRPHCALRAGHNPNCQSSCRIRRPSLEKASPLLGTMIAFRWQYRQPENVKFESIGQVVKVEGRGA